MQRKKAFAPDWTSAPGETISDMLQERSWSTVDFARRLEYSTKHTGEILEGSVHLSPEIALRLEHVLGVPAQFWLVREAQYRAGVNRQKPSMALDEWVRELPVKDMRAFGWLDQNLASTDAVAACLDFFGVADVTEWRTVYHDMLQNAVFRTSRTFRSRPHSVAAWLRRGELEAHSIQCDAWDPKRFEDTLKEVRPLTRRRDLHHFIPELTRKCATSGVAVVIVRAPEGCRTSGATRFINPQKALLLLSFRYLSDDHFWFTFFHECGHLLLHSKKALFLETDGKSDAWVSRAE
jgi:plasmid maintenance system antidote protein VapI